MKYTHIKCSQALHPLKKQNLPYGLDLNIYRGCEHQCQYCFAIYSQKYMNDDDYFNHIFIKENIVEALDRELTKRKTKEIINIGGICDSYQPIEAKMKLMPAILKVMIKHKNPIILSTKSILLLRDIALIKELSQITTVNIAATITLMAESKRSIIEPNASPSEERFLMLDRIKKETKAIVGVHIMPIIPMIGDSHQNLNYIYQRAKEIQADYVLPGTLYLKGPTRSLFFGIIQNHFPAIQKDFKRLYYDSNLKKEWQKTIYRTIHLLEDQYQIDANYHQLIPKQRTIQQLSLFEKNAS